LHFSIVIPTYNRGLFIKKAIDSVLAQTYQNWELIVVDDGSTDNTKEIIASFDDKRIKYIYQENAERSAARNRGIANATGDWICFLDSDDNYLPEHLQEISKFIIENKIETGLIYTGLIRKSIERSDLKPFLDLTKPAIIEISQKFLIPTQVCIRRNILLKDQFDPRFRLWEDTHLFMRIAAKYPVYHIEKYTAVQNIHEQGTVVQGMKKVKMSEVDQYITAINDLQNNYQELFKNKFSLEDFRSYRDAKYRMYLYQSRQNKQLNVSLQLCMKGLFNSPSIYFGSEFFKIWMNQLGLGIHGKQ